MVIWLHDNAFVSAALPVQGVWVRYLVWELRSKIPHASQPKNQNIKRKQYCNKFNKDFKNDPHQKKKNL